MRIFTVLFRFFIYLAFHFCDSDSDSATTFASQFNGCWPPHLPTRHLQPPPKRLATQFFISHVATLSASCACGTGLGAGARCHINFGCHAIILIVPCQKIYIYIFFSSAVWRGGSERLCAHKGHCQRPLKCH